MTKLKPIWIIYTPYKKDGDVPYQSCKSKDVDEIEVSKEYEEGLKDIEGFSHLIILYEFHKSVKRSVKKEHYLESQGLLVKPYLDDTPRGLFATRSPNRPNPIGLTIVELLERKRNVLKVRGVDMLDGTPLLDIKPYVPKFDQRDNVRIGWLEGKI
ncbi:MAG: tRNA (N6-threonylcarbamoyladenosine(37)-N6)-methyltransferase TrmO [Candidatus Hadarchaeum sp.]|uniref:tRNA (N6-threonylcarbamoyladenosine(37)-N6)-methyltransferase TrmO n=1 Tax=Candidatus Hadarchaeum sp. TaxID=2883567 RepID=UPI003D14636B